jgi:hypothetical protein
MEKEEFEGGCHCGTIRFRVRLKGGLAAAMRCTCSLCRMRGAVTLSAETADLIVTAGADSLATYRFNTGVAEHHFCQVCGIYTHHRRRSNPGEHGVNAACLDGVSPFDFTAVKVKDGIRHSKDRADGKSVIVGVLRYEPSAPRED